jgi:transposase
MTLDRCGIPYLRRAGAHAHAQGRRHRGQSAAYKVNGVAEAIEAAGTTIRYLPAYWPDLNPIEQPFAKLKSALRKGAARSVKTHLKLIGKLLKMFSRAVTGSDPCHTEKALVCRS